MAVLVQFTTLLIRIDRLTAVAADAVADIEARWSPSWRDAHLLAVAFMDMGARDLAAELEQLGLTLRDTSSGTRVWRDICVVDYYEGPTNPCPWLEYDPERHVAWLKGTAPGELAGPTHRHEDAPIRVSPEQFNKLVAQQHAPPKPAAVVRSHEATLLPLTQQLAAELLRLVPSTVKLEALILYAQFPARGQVVSAAVLLHEVAGERRSMHPTELGASVHALLTEISRYESGQRLTSIEIKIAGDGQTITQFGIAAPWSREQLAAHIARLYGAVPEAPAPRPAGCLFGWLLPKPARHPLPALRHAPQREPLSLFLDELNGIQEHWDDPPEPAKPAPQADAAAPRPAPVFSLESLHSLEAARTAPDRVGPPRPAATPMNAGAHLVVPEREGVLLAEARRLRSVAVAELQRERPELRFDPIQECLTRELGPGLGTLRFGTWQGKLTRLDILAEGIASFDALLARLQPVLVALGGMGPVVGALGTQRPGQVREVVPVALDELRRYLVADSPYGRKVYPCWLLGGPAHTKVALELDVGVTDGRQDFGYSASVSLP